MARRYGNAGSVSSLISSARSAYEREQAYQDQIAAYEWDLSAKTAEDHDKYVGYLTKRNKELETRDPAKALTFASKIDSTRSSFASKEIQRASIAVNYGQGTDSDKYNKMMGLYQNAVNNGDYDLAQNLEAQLGTLQIKIMNAQEAAANAASAASDKAYAATKKGLEAEKNVLDDTLKNLERAVKTGEIDRTEYLTKKKQLLTAKEETLKTFLGVQADGKITNPKGLNDEDFRKYTNELEAIRDSNPDFYGKKGDLLNRGLSPFDIVRDPNSDKVQLKDRQIGGYSWMGGNENTPGTIAAPEYKNNVDGNEMMKEFKKLGFDGGKWGTNGYEFQLDNGKILYLQIKDVNGKKIAIAKDPTNGSLMQVTPDKKTALLMSSSRAGGTDYYSPLMDSQNKATTAQSDKALGGLAGVARVVNDSKLIEATPGGSFVASGSKILGGKGKLGDWANVALAGVPGATGRIWGDTLGKIAQITGLKKRAEEKAAAERAVQARMMEANRAEAARQQATYQAQLAKSTVPALPGKQLSYNWKTGRVENIISPVFKQPLLSAPGTQDRADQVVRGVVQGGITSFYDPFKKR